MRGRPLSISDEEILDAARDVFRKRGHATTTAEIARKAGVSEGILYYRYKSKVGLLAEVIHRQTQPPEPLIRIIETADQRSLAENLELMIGALLQAVFRAHPFLELAETSSRSGEIRRLLFAKAKKPPPQIIVEIVAGYFEKEMELGRVRDIDPIPAARAIFGGCIDYVRSRAVADGDRDRKSFITGLADLFMHGAAKRDEKKGRSRR